MSVSQTERPVVIETTLYTVVVNAVEADVIVESV